MSPLALAALVVAGTTVLIAALLLLTRRPAPPGRHRLTARHPGWEAHPDQLARLHPAARPEDPRG